MTPPPRERAWLWWFIGITGVSLAMGAGGVALVTRYAVPKQYTIQLEVEAARVELANEGIEWNGDGPEGGAYSRPGHHEPPTVNVWARWCRRWTRRSVQRHLSERFNYDITVDWRGPMSVEAGAHGDIRSPDDLSCAAIAARGRRRQ